MHRRGFLCGLGASVGLIALHGSAGAQVLPAGGSYRLERLLQRGLSDGNHILVTRGWEIAFTPSGADEVEVAGQQIYADVDAPAALRALATIEEKRNSTGLFPIRLDRNGHIIAQKEAQRFAPLPEELAQAAVAYAKAQDAKPEAEADTRKFISQLSDQGIGWLSMLPRDLFFPHPRELETRRDIALPHGAKGVVEMREIARAAPLTGLLESFRREVTTIAGESEQQHSETWRLTAAVP